MVRPGASPASKRLTVIATPNPKPAPSARVKRLSVPVDVSGGPGSSGATAGPGTPGTARPSVAANSPSPVPIRSSSSPSTSSTSPASAASNRSVRPRGTSADGGPELAAQPRAALTDELTEPNALPVKPTAQRHRALGPRRPALAHERGPAPLQPADTCHPCRVFTGTHSRATDFAVRVQRLGGRRAMPRRVRPRSVRRRRGSPRRPPTGSIDTAANARRGRRGLR